MKGRRKLPFYDVHQNVTCVLFGSALEFSVFVVLVAVTALPVAAAAAAFVVVVVVAVVVVVVVVHDALDGNENGDLEAPVPSFVAVLASLSLALHLFPSFSLKIPNQILTTATVYRLLCSGFVVVAGCSVVVVVRGIWREERWWGQ